jgi:hypothetical protein
MSQELRFASEEEALVYLSKIVNAAVVLDDVIIASPEAKAKLVEEVKNEVRTHILPIMKDNLIEFFEDPSFKGKLNKNSKYLKYVEPIENQLTSTEVRQFVNVIVEALNRKEGFEIGKENIDMFVAPYFRWVAFVNGAWDNQMKRNLERMTIETVKNLEAAGHQVSPSAVEDALVKYFSNRATIELRNWRALTKPSSFGEMLNRVFRDLGPEDFQSIMQDVDIQHVGYDDLQHTGRHDRVKRTEKDKNKLRKQLDLPEIDSRWKSISQSLRSLYKHMDSGVLNAENEKKAVKFYNIARRNINNDLKPMLNDFKSRIEREFPRIVRESMYAV